MLWWQFVGQIIMFKIILVLLSIISMIYSDTNHFTPQLTFHKDNILLLDLSHLEQDNFTQIFSQLSLNSTKQPLNIKNRFQDTLLCLTDLNDKINILILPYRCFKRPFSPVDQKGLYTLAENPYDYIVKVYGYYLPVGLKVDLDNLDELEDMRNQKYFKKIKIFSFVLKQELFDKHFFKLRQVVRMLHNPKNSIEFHLDIRLNSTAGLKCLKKQLIENNYPIEFMAISTNLLNLIENLTKHTIQNHSEEIAFKYTEVIKKYIPCSMSCVLESFFGSKKYEEWSNNECVFETFNCINRKTSKEVRQYKNEYRSGIVIPESLFYYFSKTFTTDEYDHFRVRGQLDAKCFTKTYDALQGTLNNNIYD